MPKMKILITVKTYPTLSTKYDETVCTAGFTEKGALIRIYPLAFRKKSYEEQYKKYEWIEIDLDRNQSDFRPESYRPHQYDSPIKVVDFIDTASFWAERKKIVLQNVYYNLQALILEAHNKNICTSLAVFKPTKILDFKIQSVEREWDKEKIKKLEAERIKIDLFEKIETENPFAVVRKLPFKFSYLIIDDQGKESTMMIEDWEIGALYWNCLKKYENNENMACQKVKEQYFDNFAKTKDLYLFLGTTKANHYVSHNPFVIIGTFHPPIDKSNQAKLF